MCTAVTQFYALASWKVCGKEVVEYWQQHFWYFHATTNQSDLHTRANVVVAPRGNFPSAASYRVACDGLSLGSAMDMTNACHLRNLDSDEEEGLATPKKFASVTAGS